VVNTVTGLVTTVQSWDNVVGIMTGLVTTVWSWVSVVGVVLGHEMEDFWFQSR